MHFPPHYGYRTHRLPMFIIHASDRWVLLRSELGDERIRRLDELAYPRPSKRVIYSCVDPDELCIYGDPRRWTIKTWNGRISSMEYGKTKIYPLLAAWDETLLDFFAFVDRAGVAASSLNTMSLNLWRATLPSTVGFHEECPYDEMLGPLAMATGGRKEARKGVYRRRVEYDITAAYPHAMAADIPSALAPMPRSFIRSMDMDAWEGIAVARVRIPPSEWGPLPVVLDSRSELTCYGFTKVGEWVSVCLPLSELRMAMQVANVDVEILRFHAAMNWGDRFSPWLRDVVRPLRSLPGMAGVVGKLVANRLWSCFAVSPHGKRRVHTFDSNGDMYTEPVAADSPRQTLRRAATSYVGALATSRVRQKLYAEGLCGLSGVVYVDTDGCVAKPTDAIPDGWRAKTVMPYVDVAGPQAMYNTCDMCLPAGGSKGHDKGHWTVAGAESVEAKSRLFRIMKEGGVIMANIGNVLPAQDVGEYVAQSSKAEEDTYTTQGILHDTPAFTR